MKKRLAILVVAMVVLVGTYLVLSQPADAGPDSKITLNAGQTLTVARNGCALHVTKATTATVKVKCNASGAVNDGTPARAVLQKVTLSAGQAVTIGANQCNLAVTKNTASKVKVKCTGNPTPTPTPTDLPDASVTVGPGGQLKYSGDVTIHVGDTVEWTWAASNHTVTSGSGTPDNLFCSPSDTNCGSSSSSSAGAKYRHTFDTTGTFQYYCRIHGIQMTAKVFVNP